MRIIIAGIALWLLSLPAFAQNRDKLIVTANELFKKQLFEDALKYYQGADNLGEDAFVTRRIADCFRQLKQSAEAEKYYGKLQKADPDTSTYLYAIMLKRNGKYLEAKKEFKRLADNYPLKVNYRQQVQYCDSALKWLKEIPVGRVQNLYNINSEFSEVTPVQYEDGIVFSSNREESIIRKKGGTGNQPYYNLFFSRLSEKEKFRNPSLFSISINSIHHEIAPSFTPDFKKIYFTRIADYQGNDSDRDNVNRAKLYLCERKKLIWSNPLKFILNDSASSFAHPCIDPTEKLFFFASDMPGGYGGSDIYASFLVDKKWSDPVNLGPVINTSGNEYYPFYHQDGTLYFTSDGHAGMGGFDIFKAHQMDGEWIEVTNLKLPVNSSADDFSIFLTSDKSVGYFSSNRPGGLGQEDIYSINFAKP